LRALTVAQGWQNIFAATLAHERAALRIRNILAQGSRVLCGPENYAGKFGARFVINHDSNLKSELQYAQRPPLVS
jgi:hypothetical protein